MQVLGNRLTDFEKMFDLKKNDLAKKIIECGGNSSFKSDIKQINPAVVSYHADDLTKLPFKNDEFDLALAVNQVFNHHDSRMIYGLITEMSRIAFEVRIYPLCDENGV